MWCWGGVSGAGGRACGRGWHSLGWRRSAGRGTRARQHVVLFDLPPKRRDRREILGDPWNPSLASPDFARGMIGSDRSIRIRHWSGIFYGALHKRTSRPAFAWKHACWCGLGSLPVRLLRLVQAPLAAIVARTIFTLRMAPSSSRFLVAVKHLLLVAAMS